MDKELAAALAALERLAMIELPEDDPALAELGAAIDTIGAVLTAWSTRLAVPVPVGDPVPVKQIGAALLTRRFAPHGASVDVAQ